MKWWTVIVLPLAGSIGCPRSQTETKPAPPPSPIVFASFQPLADWAERLTGPDVQVRLVCSNEADPAECTPDPATIREMQSAALVLVSGAGLEKWIDTISLSDQKVLNTSATFAEELLRYDAAVEHQHGPMGEKHKHEGTDPHLWMDPNLAKKQVEQLVARFSTTWPDRATDIQARGQTLLADLEKLHRRHLDLLARLGIPTVAASHPAYDYLARRYGWRITNVSIDPEAPLDAETHASLLARSDLARPGILLFESAPNAELVETLQTKLGLAAVVFSPAETKSPRGDYLAIMNENLDRFEAALEAVRTRR